jgi:perosamine synthetase
VGVSSGTAGLHLCVRACGIGNGHEVITSPFSFVASANAILYEGARPVFVDVDPVGLNLSPGGIEAALTPRTRAILAVHVFGRPAPMEEILSIARRHGLAVIEDACEALGAEVGSRAAGTLGDCGVFAFYPNKQITTGEGGMIVTDDARLARLCRSLRNQGRDEDGGEHARLGYNYRLTELASSLGSAQLRRLDEVLARREAIARGYDRLLAACPGLVLPELSFAAGRTSWFAYVVRLAPRFAREDREWVLASMRERGIECQRYFAPLHLQPHLKAVLGHRPGDFPVAEAASERTLALPLFNRITEGEIDEVCETLLDLVRKGDTR